MKRNTAGVKRKAAGGSDGYVGKRLVGLWKSGSEQDKSRQRIATGGSGGFVGKRTSGGSAKSRVSGSPLVGLFLF